MAIKDKDEVVNPTELPELLGLGLELTSAGIPPDAVLWWGIGPIHIDTEGLTLTLLQKIDYFLSLSRIISGNRT